MIRKLTDLNVYAGMSVMKPASTEPCFMSAMIKVVLLKTLPSVQIERSSVLHFGMQTTKLDLADLKFSMYVLFQGYLTGDG